MNLRRYFTPPMGLHTITLGRCMDEVELATMLLSVLTYKANIGPMTLAVDTGGLHFACAVGLNKLYDDVMPIEIPPGIDKFTFWAAGKLVALSRMSGHVISVDLDAVLYRKPSPLIDLHGLHYEPISWATYGWNPMWETAGQLLGANGWQRLAPINVAVAAFYNEDLRDQYTNLAIKLMQICSRPNGGIPDSYKVSVGGSGSATPVAEMVFAEQYLLAVVAQSMNCSVRCIGDLDIGKDHMVPSKKAYHLWNSKRFYAKHDRAREMYLTNVMEEIYQLVSGQPEESTVQGIIHKLGLPTIRVVDGNAPAVRWSRAGEWFGPGEEVVRL